MKENFKENIKLMNKDSLVELSKFQDGEFDVCIADPPYNLSGNGGKKKIGWLQSNALWKEKKKFDVLNERWDNFSDESYQEFTDKWLKEIIRIVKPNGNILIFGSYHNIFLIGAILKQLKRKINNSIVWYKRNAFPNITQRMLCESTEYLVWAVNNDVKNAKKWTFNYEVLKKMNEGKQMRNMWDIPQNILKREKDFGKHPAQKPEKIIERLVLGFSKEGDKIIDPFMGTGVVATLCARNNRKFVGIELEKEYYNIAKKRLNNSLGLKKYIGVD